jgi:hypothetical protein
MVAWGFPSSFARAYQLNFFGLTRDAQPLLASDAMLGRNCAVRDVATDCAGAPRIRVDASRQAHRIGSPLDALEGGASQGRQATTCAVDFFDAIHALQGRFDLVRSRLRPAHQPSLRHDGLTATSSGGTGSRRRSRTLRIHSAPVRAMSLADLSDPNTVAKKRLEQFIERGNVWDVLVGRRHLCSRKPNGVASIEAMPVPFRAAISNGFMLRATVKEWSNRPTSIRKKSDRANFLGELIGIIHQFKLART